MKGLNPRPKKRGKFYIPSMRKANGHKPQGHKAKSVNAKTKVSKLDTWGCHMWAYELNNNLGVTQGP